VQVARGALDVNGTEVAAGDGVALSDEPRVVLHAVQPTEILLFDLA
jgi:redox-sensitive bicupin YhaK (pirin superfamily)